MRAVVLLAILLCLQALPTGCFSQGRDSLLRVYNSQTIYHYGGYFMKGNKRLKFSEMGEEFNFSKLGMIEYRRSKKEKTLSAVFSALGLVASVLSLPPLNNSTGKAYVLLGGQIVFGVAAWWYAGKSRKHLDHSLWQRNKDILFLP